MLSLRTQAGRERGPWGVMPLATAYLRVVDSAWAEAASAINTVSGVEDYMRLYTPVYAYCITGRVGVLGVKRTT